jgi:WD40 repeat protein
MGHADVVSALAWSPHGDWLVSGGSDGMLRWWDPQSGECVMIQEAHHSAIRSIRASRDGRWLASCGDDGAIRIWDLQSSERVQTLRHDRPYERLNITGIRGLNGAQKATLQALGAIKEEAVCKSKDVEAFESYRKDSVDEGLIQ